MSPGATLDRRPAAVSDPSLAHFATDRVECGPFSSLCLLDAYTRWLNTDPTGRRIGLFR